MHLSPHICPPKITRHGPYKQTKYDIQEKLWLNGREMPAEFVVPVPKRCQKKRGPAPPEDAMVKDVVFAPLSLNSPTTLYLLGR
jgi:hypothetical protein